MRNNSIIKKFFSLLIIFLTTNLSAQGPDWFDKVNVLCDIEGFPTTGATWGTMLDDDGVYLKEKVEYYHSLGKFYHSSMAFEWDIYFNRSVIDSSLACIDLHGNPMDAVFGEPGTFLANLHNPAWQDSLIKWVKKIIDTGADGVNIDGFWPNCLALWQDPGGSFDEFTMYDFRLYLDNKFTQEELMTKFNIADINQFNYKDWILNNGLESSWNNWPLDVLAKEFRFFEWYYANEFLAKFINISKEYANSEYSSNFLIAYNIANYYWGSEIVDFNTDEFFYFNWQFPEYCAGEIKIAKSAHDRPIVILPEVADKGFANLPQYTENFIKYILADIYASGGTSILYRWGHDNENVGTLACPQHYDNHYLYNADVLNQYIPFILNNHTLFESLKTISKVGLIYSYTSNFYNSFWQSNFDHSGVSAILIESNIQYDAVFFSDKKFGNDIPENIAELEKYSCIILPNVHSMSEHQVQLIFDYLEEGGTIIACGETGIYDEHGNTISRPNLSLLTQEGTHRYGNGYFVYFNENIGNQFTWGSDKSMKKLLADEIAKYVRTQTIVDSCSNVSIYAYQKMNNSNHLLHLVNYDYNPNIDEFTIKENFPIKIHIDTSKSWEAVYSSPDIYGQQLLSLKYENDYINIFIPKLEAYGIVSLHENSSTPQIISFAPQSYTTIIGGESLLFTVEVIDSDENPLYFKWSINGILDSSAIDTAFIYTTTRADSGIDTVSVNISDGSHTISKHWYITIKEYIFPKILFDESHNEYNTLSWDRALEVWPEHPEWVYYGILQSKLKGEYNVSRFAGTKITDSVLDSTNALVIAAARTNFTNDEVLSIKKYVEEGGGLLFIGDAGITNNSPLLNAFGISFEEEQIYYPGKQGGFDVIDFIEHPSVGNNPEYNTNWGGSFNIYSSATAIAYSDSLTWRDVNWNGLKDANEPSGPFIFMCASEYGQGHAFFIADNAFHDDFIKWENSPNDDLFLNILDWITENVNQIPTSVESTIDIPVSYKLYQNYPNPFNPTTNIKFQVPENCKVSIKIYNMLGQEIKTLVENSFSPGYYLVTWDGLDYSGNKVSTGLYFYRMEINEYVEVKKCLLLK